MPNFDGFVIGFSSCTFLAKATLHFSIVSPWHCESCDSEFKYKEAISSKTGGVAIFYKKGYKVEIAKEYDINPNNDLTMDVDNLRMHIETDHHVKILLGV
jgi:hypothetical protein